MTVGVGDREYVLAQRKPTSRGLSIGLSVKSRVTGIWGVPVSFPLTKAQSDSDIFFAARELPLFLESWQKSFPMAGSSINLFKSNSMVMATTPFREELAAPLQVHVHCILPGADPSATRLWQPCPT